MKLRIGQHLMTRDGRKFGNAIVIDVHATSPVLYDIETDFGNIGRELNRFEIEEAYYTENSEGEVVISEIERWRDDRDRLRSATIPE